MDATANTGVKTRAKLTNPNGSDMATTNNAAPRLVHMTAHLARLLVLRIGMRLSSTKAIGATRKNSTNGLRNTPVRQPPVPRRGDELPHGHGPYVAQTTRVQITGVGVVHGMRVGPVMERREGEDSRQVADGSIPAAAPKERPVSGIVKNDEYADQESGRRQREEQAEQVGHLSDGSHGQEADDVRDYGGHELADAPGHRWLPILAEHPLQWRGTRPARRSSCHALDNDKPKPRNREAARSLLVGAPSPAQAGCV